MGKYYTLAKPFILEVPITWVFLGADAQLLGISLASVRKPLIRYVS